MPSITFELETVTPLFLAGADQTTAELRPPAFRGALRYWFRAIAGSYYWNDSSLTQLRKIESELLGDTTKGSSNIIVRLSKIPNELQLSPVRLDQDQNPGLSYLWFSMKGSGGRNPRPQRLALGVKTPLQFSLTLSTRPNPRNSEQQENNLLIAANCFWLAVNLGGFGSRERRGAGSLRVRAVSYQGIDDTQVPLFIISNYKPSTICNYLRGEFKKVRNNSWRLLGFDIEQMPQIEQMPSLEIYSKYTSKVLFLKEPYSDWKQALESIGEKYKIYRQRLALEKRAIFGLPLMKFNPNTRRASPLRIKVIQSGNRYYCLLSQIKASFPEDSKIKNYRSPSYRSVNEFIASFSEDEIQTIG